MKSLLPTSNSAWIWRRKISWQPPKNWRKIEKGLRRRTPSWSRDLWLSSRNAMHTRQHWRKHRNWSKLTRQAWWIWRVNWKQRRSAWRSFSDRRAKSSSWMKTVESATKRSRCCTQIWRRLRKKSWRVRNQRVGSKRPMLPQRMMTRQTWLPCSKRKVRILRCV